MTIACTLAMTTYIFRSNFLSRTYKVFLLCVGICITISGCAKKKTFQKSENTMEVGGWVGGWVQVSLGIFVCGKSSQNSSKPVHIFWSSIPYVFCLYVHC